MAATSEEGLSTSIVEAIKAGAQTVKQIAEKVGKNDGTVRKHLKALLEAKRVVEKKGLVKKAGPGKNGRPSNGYVLPE